MKALSLFCFLPFTKRFGNLLGCPCFDCQIKFHSNNETFNLSQLEQPARFSCWFANSIPTLHAIFLSRLSSKQKRNKFVERTRNYNRCEQIKRRQEIEGENYCWSFTNAIHLEERNEERKWNFCKNRNNWRRFLYFLMTCFIPEPIKRLLNWFKLNGIARRKENEGKAFRL